jgi:toxoflavin biosynthesis protein ToxD
MSTASPSATIPRIFVSHSHQDDDYCRAFVHELRAAGVDVWYDEHNLTSGQLLTDIQRELHARPIFVPILSKAALHESTWVKNECMWAFTLYSREPGRTFLPVTGAPIEQSDFGADWMFLEGFKRIEAPKLLPYLPQEAARRVLTATGHMIPLVEVAAPVPATAAAAPVSDAPRMPSVARAAPSTPSRQPAPHRMPPDRFPPRLADLGFTPRNDHDTEYIVPPLCPIPAGPFLMGSDKHRDPNADSDEQPQHIVTLPAYQIARFPVTVAKYACFVRAGHASPALSSWQRQLGSLDHPIISVSWHDASAYTAWLAHLTGQPWPLPNEAEWEKAARGTDGRIYPWGDTFDASHANTKASGKGDTTPVGSYPTGASPAGAQDMAGNVWEWTSSVFKSYPYSTDDGYENVNSTENRVRRGGSMAYVAWYARAACRIHLRPDLLGGVVGFRVALAVAAGAGS